MATIDSLISSVSTKMLVVGDSGAGKTGAVMSLIAAGYRVRVLDWDAGVQIFRDYFINPNSIYRKPMPGLWTQQQADTLKERFIYETVTDKMIARNGKLMPGKATAWTRGTQLLDKWNELGGISTWTNQDILVIDSLTFMCRAALNFVLSMNARLGQKPWQEDWGAAQQAIDTVLQMLYDDSVSCNVVVLAHLKLYGSEGSQKWFPETLGKALSPNVGRYFNTVLAAETTGSGLAAKRKLVTKSKPGLELKTPIPMRVKPEYELSTGLAEYFKAERAGTENSIAVLSSANPEISQTE